MNIFNKPPTSTNDAADLLHAGGAQIVPTKLGFIHSIYEADRGPIEYFGVGRDAGRNGIPLTSAESPIVAQVEAARSANIGRANSLHEQALAELDLGLGELDEPATRAAFESQFNAPRYAAEEQVKPAIDGFVEARHNRTEFELLHRRRPVIPGESYDPNAPLIKPFLWVAAAAVPDGAFNVTTYLPIMLSPWQAIAMSFCGCIAMAFCGILFGTGLRYFNYQVGRAVRLVWRTLTIASGFLALDVAVGLAQYRSLLELAASEGQEPSSYSIFSVAPSLVGLPVLIGCAIVFACAVLKFMGGKGQPYTRYGDHAAHDRPVRVAEAEIAAIKEDLSFATEEIRVEGINGLYQEHEDNFARLKQAKKNASDARLICVDLRNSFLSYVRAAEPDLALLRAGYASARPDLDPEAFLAVNLRPSEGFPVPSEIEDAIVRAEAAHARRSAQLANLEKAISDFAIKSREDFSKFVARESRRRDSRGPGSSPINL